MVHFCVVCSKIHQMYPISANAEKPEMVSDCTILYLNLHNFHEKLPGLILASFLAPKF